MTLTQAQNFANQWRVVAQYNHSETTEWVDELGLTHEIVSSNGLSATVFENVDGQRYLAVRGTEITDLNDIATDVIDIGALGTAEHQAQYSALSAQVQTWLDNGVLRSGFTVAGHSLGGFLATNLALDYLADVAHTYLYNAPGVMGVIGGDLFVRIKGTDLFIDSSAPHLSHSVHAKSRPHCPSQLSPSRHPAWS
ncbi:MAG: hypothetical protein U1D97_07460 [Desulfuromonadales bacterium]|nr:hypothetical protein [Desulfuromonadales bacterium]